MKLKWKFPDNPNCVKSAKYLVILEVCVQVKPKTQAPIKLKQEWKAAEVTETIEVKPSEGVELKKKKVRSCWCSLG